MSRVVFCFVVDVLGVTQLHDVVYMVCFSSSTIVRFNATTRERLTDIHIKDLKDPRDIVACEQTSRLYVPDSRDRVWRVSADGADIKLWWTKSSTDTFRLTTLSMTSTRLLVTSLDTKQLIQLDSLGDEFDSLSDELRRVQLPDDMEPRHAVESPTTTFIVSHENKQLKQWRMSEVNVDGQVLRQFTGSRLSPLGWTRHVVIDSHGNVFVADGNNRRILLLDAQLRLRRVIIDEQLNDKHPRRLCYIEQTGQLLVGLLDSVVVFDVLPR